jgi:hypothetical protein
MSNGPCFVKKGMICLDETWTSPVSLTVANKELCKTAMVGKGFILITIEEEYNCKGACAYSARGLGELVLWR